MAALILARAVFQAPYTNAATVITAPIPAISASAGGKVTCPTFGVQIMRVTTASDGNAADHIGTSYGYYPSFNRINNRLLVAKDTGNSNMIVYDFDPVSFTLGTKYDLPASPAAHAENAFWANNSDYLCYVFDTSFRLYRFDFTDLNSITSTLIADFRGVGGIGVSDKCWQPLMASDDDTFSLNWRNSGDSDIGIAVVKGSTVSVPMAQLVANLDETAIARDGTYAVAVLGGGAGTSQSSIRSKVYKVSDSTHEDLTYGPPDEHVSHATAYGSAHDYVGIESFDIGSVRKRSMDTPHTQSIVRTNGFLASWYNIHLSALATDSAWLLQNVTAYQNVAPAAMCNEVFQIAMDGSGAVKRWFNHFNYYDNTSIDGYYVTPRATITKDGRYVAFSSNWGVKDGRTDMFVAKLPGA